MNGKKAKQLRREANYHPQDHRDYVQVNLSRQVLNPKNSFEMKQGTIELTDDSPRYLYQQLKKEYYQNKGK